MSAPEFTQRERELIRNLADNDMNVYGTARAMKRNHNTLIYHMRKIERKTGLNPARFHDLVELLDMIQRKDTDNE